MANNETTVVVKIADDTILELIRGQVRQVLRTNTTIQEMIEEEILKVIERKTTVILDRHIQNFLDRNYEISNLKAKIARDASVMIGERVTKILNENQAVIEAEAEELKKQQVPIAEYMRDEL